MNSELIRYQSGQLDQGSNLVELSKPINRQRLVQVLMDYWWLILLIGGLAGGATGYFWKRIPVKYQAKAVLQVEQEEQRVIGIDEVTHQDLRSIEVLNTIVQNIKNTSVLLRVAQTNHLAEDKRFWPRGATNRTEAQAVRMLSVMTTAKLRPETRLVDITVTHSNPEIAMNIANSVAQEFIRQNQEQRFSTATAANELLFEEAGKLKEKLETAEKRIQNYKESQQIVSMEDHQSIAGDKLKELNQKLTEMKAERLRWEAEVAQFVRIANNPEGLLKMPQVTTDPTVIDLQKKIAEQKSKVALLATRYKSKHPKMIQAQEELNDLQTSLASVVQTIPQTINSSYSLALAREKNLESATHDAQLESLDVDKRSIQYNVLVREAQSDRALYDSVLKRLKETDITKGLSSASIALVEPAARPGAPDQIPMLPVAGLALVMSCAGMLGVVYLVKTWNGTIQTVDEAEKALGVTVWTAIPVNKRSRQKRLPHIMADEPESMCSEAFRTLRTTTGLVSVKKEKRIHLFTSADPAEGKTFCSLNYAICQAQEGRRTLLIDLDLRRPSLAKSFNLPPETPGVTNYLTKHESLRDLVRRSPYPNLDILTAGPHIPNPAEMLASGLAAELLQEAALKYDRVIVDTAPINAVSDTFLILPSAHIVYLVVRCDKTPRQVIARAVDLMARAGIPPTGIVLNFLPKRTVSRYSYYYGPERRNHLKVNGSSVTAIAG